MRYVRKWEYPNQPLYCIFANSVKMNKKKDPDGLTKVAKMFSDRIKHRNNL